MDQKHDRATTSTVLLLSVSRPVRNLLPADNSPDVAPHQAPVRLSPHCVADLSRHAQQAETEGDCHWHQKRDRPLRFESAPL